MVRAALLTVALPLMPHSGAAEVLVDHPWAPSGASDAASQRDVCVAYDDFVLDAPAAIGHVAWWGKHRPGMSRQAFSINFYSDANGRAGAPLSSQTIDGAASESFVESVFGWDSYSHGADLPTPFIAQPNAKYWLSILDETPLGDGNQWFWDGSDGGNWSSYLVYHDMTTTYRCDRAFVLSTARAPAVPEAGTLTLLLGAAPFALIARRRR
jgi:hypothetical protein